MKMALIVDTKHEDIIHSAEMDYYGIRLATSSSDHSVKIFDARNGSKIAELRGHEGPVWRVSWAHPKFGQSILASCSYDRRVIIWKEERPGSWAKWFEYNNHNSSVNAVEWAPHDAGLMLSCASSDGCVSVLSLTNSGQWDAQKITGAHIMGCNAVSWCPTMYKELGGSSPKRFVTGGGDCLIKVWRETEQGWHEETRFEGVFEIVRDVAWASSVIQHHHRVASCYQDGSVLMWNSNDDCKTWNATQIYKSSVNVWSVSWSILGNILACAEGDGKTTLWKESVEQCWECISNVQDGGMEVKGQRSL